MRERERMGMDVLTPCAALTLLTSALFLFLVLVRASIEVPLISSEASIEIAMRPEGSCQHICGLMGTSRFGLGPRKLR